MVGEYLPEHKERRIKALLLRLEVVSLAAVAGGEEGQSRTEVVLGVTGVESGTYRRA